LENISEIAIRFNMRALPLDGREPYHNFGPTRATDQQQGSEMATGKFFKWLGQSNDPLGKRLS